LTPKRCADNKKSLDFQTSGNFSRGKIMARTGSAVSSTNVFDVARDQLTALVGSLDDFADGDDEASETILMDQDIGGRRYLLVRLPLTARNGHCLSPRELEIVRLVAEGHPNKVIAAVLDISAWTVSTHVRRVFGKLCVTSRAAMVARMAEFARQPDQALRGSPASRPRELVKAPIDPSSFAREGERLAHRHCSPTGSECPVVRRSGSAQRNARKQSFSPEIVQSEHSVTHNASR
jgi:DNA-binding CsgD family transcriptional regulator